MDELGGWALSDDLTSRSDDHPGSIGIDGVELLERLGRGANSVVYRCRRGGQSYAVKLLHGMRDSTHVGAFRREAAVLASLSHRALARIHEVGDAAGRPYLIMDLVEGRSLADLLAEGPLRPLHAVEVGNQVAMALAVAHRAGLVHRDVKPQNIVIRPDGTACLIDFGLVTRAGDRAQDVAVGTFAYSAPEQSGVLRRAVDGRADLYALGVVLFECLAGVVPFTATDVGELVQAHMSTPAPDLTTVAPGVWPPLAAVVARLLAKDPDDRYPTAVALAADLAKIATWAAAGADGPLDLGGPVGDAGPTGAATDVRLVGREADLRVLLDAWRRARDGRGGAVVVAGPPGSGKSRLVRELVATARADGRTVLYGKCPPQHAVPLAVLRNTVEAYLRDVARLPPAQRELVEERIRSTVGEAAGLVAALTPALAPILAGLPAEADLAGEDNQRQFAVAVARLLVGLVEDTPGTILHLDDGQWCDEASRRVLRQLAPMLDAAGILLVSTARDDPDSLVAVAAFEAELAAAKLTRLTVQPLTPQAVADLVAGQLGAGAVPDELVARLAARGAGNALAILEYVRAVIDAGLVRPSWGTWVLDEAGLDALALPTDVMDLVLRRVDGLGGRARQVLTAAAAIGVRFEPDVVASACAADIAEVQSAITEAAAHQLIEVAPSGGYAFLHDRIREALLSEVDESTQRELHQRIAEYLETIADPDSEVVYAIAAHYRQGHSGRTADREFRALAAAGALAIREHVPGDALEYLSFAWQVAQTAGIRPEPEFHVNLGLAAGRCGRYALALDHLELARAAESEPVRQASIDAILSDVHFLRSHGDDAQVAARRGLTVIGHPLPEHPAIAVMSALGFLVLGLVLGLLPARWRVVTGPRRIEYELWARLLQAEGYGAGMALNRLGVMTVHLRGVYVSRRLGWGPEFARFRALLSIAMGAAGRPGKVERLHREATANALGDPRLSAMMEWVHGLATDAVLPIDTTSGRGTLQVMQRNEAYLDLGLYLTSASIVCQFHLLRGELASATRLVQRVRGMASAEEMAGSPFALMPAYVAALAGRSADASVELDRVRQALAQMPTTPMSSRLGVAVAAVYVALEQGEVGEVFDRAAAEFAELPHNASTGLSYQRPVFVYLAFGRLAQAAAAPPDQLPQRLAQARTAVKVLGRVAVGPVLRAYRDAARASLLQLNGDHRGALGKLGRLQQWSGRLDMPLLDFEVARIRARASAAMGWSGEARRVASIASLIATESGWQRRARAVQTEFGIERSISRSSHTAAPSYTGQGGAELSGANRRLQALERLAAASASVLESDHLIGVAMDETVRILSAERAFLFLYDPATDQLVPGGGRDSAGQDLRELTGYGSTLVERVRNTREPLVVTGSEEGVALGSESTVVHGLRSIMVAPLQIKGRLIGVVYLDSRVAKGIFTADDLDTLAAITSHVALSLETTRAAELDLAVRTAERERDIAEALRTAIANLTATVDPDEVLRRLFAAIARVLPVDRVTVTRFSAPGFEVPLSATTDQRPAPREVDQPGTVAWLSVPLPVDGRSDTVLVAATDDRPYTEAELQIAGVLAGAASTAHEKAVLFRKVEFLAERDGLTGLYNRRHFMHTSRKQVNNVDERSPVAAVMIDIDHFKSINDTYGHGVGDEVIQAVASRLAAGLRDSDVICRYGGEEFAVLLTRTTDAQAIAVAGRLRAAIADEPVSTAAGELPVTVSVGLARPGATELDTLLKQADDALYCAKRDGRNRVAGV